jgi:hypothetical protein
MILTGTGTCCRSACRRATIRSCPPVFILHRCGLHHDKPDSAHFHEPVGCVRVLKGDDPTWQTEFSQPAEWFSTKRTRRFSLRPRKTFSRATSLSGSHRASVPLLHSTCRWDACWVLRWFMAVCTSVSPTLATACMRLRPTISLVCVCGIACATISRPGVIYLRLGNGNGPLGKLRVVCWRTYTVKTLSRPRIGYGRRSIRFAFDAGRQFGDLSSLVYDAVSAHAQLDSCGASESAAWKSRIVA